jgi:hypothetical protein
MTPFQILKLSIVRKNKISVPSRKKCQPPKVQFSINILRKIWKPSVGSGWLVVVNNGVDPEVAE